MTVGNGKDARLRGLGRPHDLGLIPHVTNSLAYTSPHMRERHKRTAPQQAVRPARTY